ncbi:Bacteriophytochrome (light-regulated signal transduction histidine kinase) [Stigmatella aurantiaca]|uniref:histidine kinase n=1 Tax=Stigmatella aurantiaca TaxID=41 RepID=A0A1H8AQZ3_STIAU|nr:ATP-binding protein [Stigmatella aurantiaca]SEM73132.1 Bacteriophytochrome (light-regulated signal transduction histidine kinase) [Stigmatella aurantiaca]
MSTELARSSPEVDLSNCDREPIHIPGAIQPHGVLLVLSEPELRLTHVSENAPSVLGTPAGQLLGAELGRFIEPSVREPLEAGLRSERLKQLNPLKVVWRVGSVDRFFDGIAHRHQGKLILELEPSAQREPVPFLSFFHGVREGLSRLRDARDLQELCEAVVQEVRNLTGFDRAIIYRFDAEWHGSVLAEARDARADPYLGLRFPASDIPRQARELYQLNGLRIISTIDYQPARVLALPGHEAPLDMSFSVLRSVSPIHLEYLHNMGVQASMSISLMRDGKLWGLISCTHVSGPKYVPYEVRTACEFLGEVMSSLLAVKEGNEDYGQRIRAKSIHASLLERMAREVDFVSELARQEAALLELVHAHGAAIHFHGRTTVLGQAPADEHLSGLIEWLGERTGDGLFCTDRLASEYPEAANFQQVAAGLIAISMSRGRNNFVLWFRPEVVQTVSWGGNPTKPVEVDRGEPRIHPRKSFEQWKETVRGRCLPWKGYEVEAAAELRRSIIDVALQRSEELLKLNTELERSNVELDAFAYAASHDLKEPLRGIHNYTLLALREAGEVLPTGPRERLDTVVRLTQRMESLINSLLHYAQVGRTELLLRETDLNEVVNQVLELLRSRLEEANVEVRIPHPLPPARCDRVRIAEVFTNLITNAIKYNDKAARWVELGAVREGSEARVAYFVRDNGIGIKPEYHETIFRIFKRLHGRDRFGGGTGTGLTIVKRIIERHNGRIWLESTPGQGSAFFFTLAAEMGSPEPAGE